MKWVKDRTGRFPERPHYETDELDAECENIIESFLKGRHGKMTFPIATDDLTVLIERDVEDFDQYADLSLEEGEVEGVTTFVPGRQPTVRISRLLSETPNMENRLRTTITHEYGHVRFHRFMFEMKSATPSLFPDSIADHTNKCKRETILHAGQTDWMEWQAGYACGAFLMPITALRETVKVYLKQTLQATAQLPPDSPAGLELISTVSKVFHVSNDAARVRLLQKKMLMADGSNVGSALFV